MTNRDDYLTGCAVKMIEDGMPVHLVQRFAKEVGEHPNEYPTITRDVNEVYPAPDRNVRCYEPGILHWEWADGSGFPPSESEKRARAIEVVAFEDYAYGR